MVRRRWSPSWLVVLFAAVPFASPQMARATTEWSVVPTPRASDISYAISCTTSGACAAVGSLTSIQGSTRTLAEQFDEGEDEWLPVPTPNPGGTKSGALLGISCVVANACVAVGTYTTSVSGMTLAERWNGTSWSIVPTPNPAGASSAQFTQVSCTAATACTAVGYSTHEGSTLTLVERWNGTEWVIQESPNPSGSANAQLHSVSCTSSSACTAVGYDVTGTGAQVPLGERWNGTAWSLQVVPSPTGSTGAQLRGVSCASSSACIAVGAYKISGAALTLAERWNGTEWRVQSTPNSGAANNTLNGVACTGASSCTAVGGASPATLAEHWNGTEWSIQETPVSASSSTFYGISCTSAASCKAAGENGENGSLEEILTGSSWSVERTRHATDDSEDVSCTSAGACIAVGSYYPLSDSGSRILVERWNGTAWSAQSAPNPPETTAVFFDAVSCAAVNSCTAVGSYTDTTGAGTLTLAEHWDGSAWSIQETPNLSGARNVGFSGVSCTTENACTAVGTAEGPEGSTTLVERWNGIAWAIQPSPNPPGSTNAQLYEVSCASSSSCIAVGYYFTSSFATNLPLVERWNGTTWSIQAVPLPTGGEDGALFGVSCFSASSCTAVGQYLRPESFNDETLAERWNGTEWSVQSTPNGGSFGNNLAGVSCRASNACSAVGSFSASTLAEGWNGTEWLIQSTSNPESNSDLRGVSCTAATFCMAAGSNGGQGSLEEIYTG
jgi:hypothetical protein